MCLAGIRRKLSPVLVILLLVSFFVIAFHHHDDGDDHPDCPICIAAHVAHSTGINTVAFNYQLRYFGVDTTRKGSVVFFAIYLTSIRPRSTSLLNFF